MSKVLPIKPEEANSTEDLRKAINKRFSDLDKRFDRYELHFQELHKKIDGVKTLTSKLHKDLINRIDPLRANANSPNLIKNLTNYFLGLMTNLMIIQKLNKYENI